MALMNRSCSQMGPMRSDSFLVYTEHNSLMMEKRQLFLRSYQFCRKQSLTEKMKCSLVEVKRVMWLKLRSARKLRKSVWSRLRLAFICRRRRRFLRLIGHHSRRSYRHFDSSSNCFW